MEGKKTPAATLFEGTHMRQSIFIKRSASHVRLSKKIVQAISQRRGRLGLA
jgi:hypothetical protein